MRSLLLSRSIDLVTGFPGQYQRPGYHYPKSVVWNDHLYASYVTNKEDVELTRVPLKRIVGGSPWNFRERS